MISFFVIFKISFFKKIFQEHVTCIRVTNGLNPDQDRPSVGPDLGPNCLQRLSAEELFACLEIFMIFCHLLTFFSKSTFSKKNLSRIS